MEEGVVKVRFRADRIEGPAIPTPDLLNEVLAEVCTLLILFCVVEVDLQ